MTNHESTFDASDVPVVHASSRSAAIAHHWVGGDPITTHLYNALGLLAPDCRRFSIRIARDELPNIDSLVLRAKVRGAYREWLRLSSGRNPTLCLMDRQGYEVRGLVAAFQSYLAALHRVLPAPMALAYAAGVQQCNAWLCGLAAQGPLARPTTKTDDHLIADEVLRHTADERYLLRALGSLVARCSLVGWLLLAASLLLWQDLRSGRTTLRIMLRSLWRFRNP